MRFYALLARLTSGALLAALAFGQTPSGLPAFDTISIHAAGPAVPGHSSFGTNGSAESGQITYLRQNLIGLLLRAYGVAVDQIIPPQWMYDIQTPVTYSYIISVTMPPGTPEDQIDLMLQNLLADRFHIKMHHETREFPAYDLVVADGGPKLKESVSTPGGMGGTMGAGVIRMKTNRQTMAEFAAGLGVMVRESKAEVLGVSVPRVTDKTGLTGRYAFSLEFAGWHLVPGESLTEAQKATIDPNAAKLPDLFSALESQLGLKLVKVVDIPLDVLVIDHADTAADGN